MSINFKVLVQEIENKTGRCTIPQNNYDWVDGYRVDCMTGKQTFLKVYYLIEDGQYGHSIRFLNGVTGFESYSVFDLLQNKKDHPTGFWAACCETIGRWDGLYVNAKQVEEKLKNLPFDLNLK